MTQHAEAIWNVANKIRGREPMSIEGLFKACHDEGVPTTQDELLFIIRKFMHSPDHFVPKEVSEFVAKLLEPYAPKSILDPWAGMGFLPVSLKESLAPDEITASTRNHAHAEVWQIMEGTEGISLKVEDGLIGLSENPEQYDAIVSCPPWGMHSQSPLTVEIDGESVEVKDDYGHLLMLEACRHLNPDGVAVFVTFGGFFTKSGKPGKARHTLARLGFRPTVAIELPAGTFSPLTSIPTHVVVLERSESDTLFTGRFSPEAKHQQALLKNLHETVEGKSAALGRIVDIESFRCFTAIDLWERIQQQAQRTGLVGYAFGDVVTELNAPKSTKDTEGFDEKPNSVYLPQMAATAATANQEELPEKLKSYYQLVVDPDVADAEFLARLLNTSFGQLWRDLLRSGTTIPRIGKALLEESTIFLPPKKSRNIQADVLDCQHAISRLRNEINELEAQLWRRPGDVKKVLTALDTVNKEERFEDWLDTLPFPLASILWVCHTQSGSLKEQYERKIHFFEALSEFLGIVFLSAFSANDAIWADNQTKLKEALDKGKLSLDMATFGTWKAVVELFSASARRLMADDEELVFELFKTRNRDVLNALFSKRLVSLFQATNKIRNDWQGHTGIVPDRDAKMVNDMLDQHVQTVREIFGVVWEGFELLLPVDAKMKSGVFHFGVKKIMGTRTPFPTESVTVVDPMEDGHLHLKSPDENRGLKLLPLVKVMPSPKTEENACYFYNRRQTEGIRFLSYYFEADAEVVDEFSDVDLVLGNLMAMGRE